MSILSVTNVSGVAARSFVIACLVFVTTACTARYPDSPTPAPTVARIELHYESAHEAISPGSTVSLTLYAVNTEGIYENVSSRARWYSTNTGVVQFSSVTNVRGVRDGSADVIAEYQGLTAAARIVVRSTASTLEVSRPSTVFVGATTALTVRLSAGLRPDVTARCVLTSSDPTIVSVEGNRLTGRAPGTVAITVQMEQSAASTFYISVPPRRGFP